MRTACLVILGCMCGVPGREALGGVEIDPSNARLHAVVGKVVAVEFEQKAFTVRSESGNTFRLRYDSKTRFAEGGKNATAQAVLRMGREIIATCENRLARIVKPMELQRDEPAFRGWGGL